MDIYCENCQIDFEVFSVVTDPVAFCPFCGEVFDEPIEIEPNIEIEDSDE